MIFTHNSALLSEDGLCPAPLRYNGAIFELKTSWASDLVTVRRFIVYRCQQDLRSPSWLAVSELNEANKPIDYRRLELPTKCQEDPRVVVADGKVHVFYNTGAPPDGAFDIAVAIYDAEWNLLDHRTLIYRDRVNVEKNWQMFRDPHTGGWMCLYSVKPWKVLRCEDWILTAAHEGPGVTWPWGSIRGGASPVFVPPPPRTFVRGRLAASFYAWIHSSYQHPTRALDLRRQYVGGLLAFDAEAPYAPVGISRFPLILPDAKAKAVVTADVVFPAGAVINEGIWTISSGSGDCQLRLDSFSHDEIICPLNWIDLTKGTS